MLGFILQDVGCVFVLVAQFEEVISDVKGCQDSHPIVRHGFIHLRDTLHTLVDIRR
jgi:hypothetical protein